MDNKIKLEDTCLTVEQAKELQALGVDMSDSLMVYCDYYDQVHDYDSKAGMPIPYRGGMKALFVLLVCNVSFYCFFRDMSDALAIIRTRPQCREAAP